MTRPSDRDTITAGDRSDVVSAAVELGDPADVAPGMAIGRYVVEGTLGAGGMGVVYLARDPRLDRRVALKVLRYGKPELATEARARLRREARVLARASHPNIVEVFDVGTYAGNVFVAMEVIRGVTLGAWVEARPPSWRAVVDKLIEAGRGIAAAHGMGLVHRDIKPGNILVADDGTVKVVDFGLARPDGTPSSSSAGGRHGSAVDRSADSVTVTEAGVVVGTPAYMAPEQFRTTRTDARSDQYSFCLTAYRCLFGRLPFDGPGMPPLDIARNTLRPEPPARSDVPRRLWRVLARGLRIDPEARFASMDALLHAVERARSGTVATRRFVAGAGVLLVAGIALPPAVHSPAPTCEDGAAAWNDAWGPARRASARQAFVSSDAGGADEAWSRVATALDRYGSRWVDAHAAACAVQNRDAVFDRRMACLHRARRAVEAFSTMLPTAEDQVLVRTPAAVAGLPSLAACATPGHTQAGLDPATRRRVEALQAEAAEVTLLLDTGRFDAGLERAAALEAHARELEHPGVLAEALYLHGRALAEAGDIAKAAERLEDAQFEAELAGDDPRLATILAELIYRRGQGLRDFAGALALGRAALAVTDRLPEPDGARGRILNGLGNAHEGAADYPAAIARYTEALELLRRSDGPTSAAVARTLNNLGNVASRKGAYDEANRYYDEAHRIWVDALGVGHPDVVMPLINLTVLDIYRGRITAAKAGLEAIIANWERAYGPSHEKLLVPISNYAAVLRDLGLHEDAVAWDRRNIALSEAEFGENHEFVARARVGYGSTLMNLRRYEESAAEFRRALSIHEHVSGTEHETVAGVWTALAKVQVELESPELAVDYIDRAIAIKTAIFGADHLLMGHEYYAKARVHNALGRHREAIAEARRALAVREGEEVDPQDFANPHLEIARALHGLGADPRRVRAEAIEARDIYRAAEYPSDADAIDAWLDELGIGPS